MGWVRNWGRDVGAHKLIGDVLAIGDRCRMPYFVLTTVTTEITEFCENFRKFQENHEKSRPLVVFFAIFSISGSIFGVWPILAKFRVSGGGGFNFPRLEKGGKFGYTALKGTRAYVVQAKLRWLEGP